MNCVFHLRRRYVILQKTLAYPIQICIAKEKKQRRKNAANRKKGVVREILASPSAVFRGVSYLLHPGHEYELGPSRSGIGARPISCMLVPWATVSCCSGSSHCSALCNYTVYSPPPLYSFSESLTSFPSLPRTFPRRYLVLFNVRLAGRGPAGSEGCAETAVFEYLPCYLPQVLVWLQYVDFFTFNH